MAIKIIIVLLLIGNVLALGRAFVTLMVDQGKDSKRTAKWLLIRVSLAGLLILAVVVGILTGDLVVTAPWHGA